RRRRPAAAGRGRWGAAAYNRGLLNFGAAPCAPYREGVQMSASPRLGFIQCISPAGLHRMAYHEWGDPANPRVLVCVHGLTRTGRDFDTLARALCGEYRVVCPDVAGRGRSDWLAD